MKNNAIALFAIFAILFFSSLSGVFCEETNSIYIKVYEDGSALWNLETRFELKTQEDIEFFNEYMTALDEDKDFIIQKKERFTSKHNKQGSLFFWKRNDYREYFFELSDY